MHFIAREAFKSETKSRKVFPRDFDERSQGLHPLDHIECYLLWSNLFKTLFTEIDSDLLSTLGTYTYCDDSCLH